MAPPGLASDHLQMVPFSRILQTSNPAGFGFLMLEALRRGERGLSRLWPSAAAR